MTTPQSFVQFLNDRRPEDEKILAALRFYVAEATDDKLPRELRAEIDSVVPANDVSSSIAHLEGNRSALVQIALAFFASGWEDPEDRERIIRSFDGVSTKLPVFESGLIAIVGMYAMFLWATGGRRTTKRTIVRRPDGTFELKVEEQMFGPVGPLQSIVSLLTGKAAKT